LAQVLLPAQSSAYRDAQRRPLISDSLCVCSSRTLANAFPPCGLAVSVASDGMIFRSDVYSASNAKDDGWAPVVRTLPWDPSVHASRAGFGNKAVLVLVNVRLGTNTVNPIYYDSLKVCQRDPAWLPSSSSDWISLSPPYVCTVAFHRTADCGDSRRKTKLVLLLHWLSRRLPLLPRSAFHASSRSPSDFDVRKSC
jgi:hypothetical protein